MQNLVNLLKERAPTRYSSNTYRSIIDNRFERMAKNFLKEPSSSGIAKFDEATKNLHSTLTASLEELLATSYDSRPAIEIVIKQGLEIQPRNERIRSLLSDAYCKKAISLIKSDKRLISDADHCLQIIHLIKESLQLNPNNASAQFLLRNPGNCFKKFSR